jgi:hypothetical protein
MLAANGRNYEVIFNPVGKNAILRAEDDLIWLKVRFKSINKLL